MTKPALRTVAGLLRIWTEVGATQQYYPLTHSVFWIEYHLFGSSTLGYHLFSILLHGASALLLVVFLRRLGVTGAWFAGWLFALHPVMVESVAWISELKNTLSGVFFLGAALAYLKFDDERRIKPYVIACVMFFCGLLAKTVVATLPAALLVVFWWRRGHLGWKRDVAPLLPLFAMGLGAGLFTAWVERRFIGAVGSEFNLTVIERFLIAGRAIWFYLSKLLWPANLVFIYPRWRIDSTAIWQYLFPVALLLVLAFFWRWRDRSRTPLAVLLIFGLMLFPSLGFFNVYPFRYSFVADHFQYLASLSPLTVAAACMDAWVGRLKGRSWRGTPALLRFFLLVVLFFLSRKQSGMYANLETLYETTISRNPECWMAHYNLGILLANRGHTEAARAHYSKAVELNPDHAKAHINLAVVLAKMGQGDEAIAHCRRALEINPNSAEAHYNLGIVLAEVGRVDEAKVEYSKALEISPNSAEAHYNLGNLLVDTGHADEAEAHYLKALAINPANGAIINSLGVLLGKTGRSEEAMSRFQKALEVNPQDAEAHSNLGISLGKAGRTEEALFHYRKSLEINPKYAEAHNNLCVLLTSLKRGDEALSHCRKAWQLNPGEIRTLKNLAMALGQQGLGTEAGSLLQNAFASAKSAGDEARARMIELIFTKLRETGRPTQVNTK